MGDKLCQIMQNKPNFRNDKMNTTFLLTKVYENEIVFTLPKEQSQTKPISSVTLQKWGITSEHS